MKNNLKDFIKKSPIVYKILLKLFYSLRHDRIKIIKHWLISGHIVRQIRISRFLKNNSCKMLQVGGGKHNIKEKGWINGDIIGGNIYLNATKKLPFPNQSFQYIFAEQFLEHLSLRDGIFFLKQCFRILKPGGVIRLAVPDLKSLIRVYYDKNPHVPLKKAMERHKKHHNHELTTPCHFFNDFFRLWGHRFIYDEETLRRGLETAGFSNITRCKFGKSSHKKLKGRERHADVEWMKYGWTLIREGIKK
ncbi:methyltransferase domain-containing protein [bacterium]|nr:methyltransferase domain-containing protein [bacterium]